MDVVELEALNVGRIQEGGAHGAEPLIPADDGAMTRSLHIEDSFRCCARPWKLGSDQCTGNPVEDQIFCVRSHLLRDILQLNGGDKIAHLASRASGSTGRCQMTGVYHIDSSLTIWKQQGREAGSGERIGGTRTSCASSRALAGQREYWGVLYAYTERVKKLWICQC